MSEPAATRERESDGRLCLLDRRISECDDPFIRNWRNCTQSACDEQNVPKRAAPSAKAKAKKLDGGPKKRAKTTGVA